MRRLSGNEVRREFLSFFAKRGHAVIPSSSLIPKADPTLLFTNAGMVQFKDVFLGLEKRSYTRATSCQKCVRAGGKHSDLENVGRTARHHTFFEMLGNFSFGDYFKEQAIEYAWELLTVGFGLPPEKLWATIYQDDDEAFELWQKIAGLPEERIARMGEKDNFWTMGETGPCGPCSEIIIDQGPGAGCLRRECDITCGCDRYLELWNLVFMQFERCPDGSLAPLPKPSIDTGAGLERLSAVLQGVASNFDTDLLRPLIACVEELSARHYGEDKQADVSMRVIADHARAVTFLLSDGVLPSNEGRGYVLRRILRRGLRHGRLLGLEEPFLTRVSGRVIDLMKEAYPELEEAKERVATVTLHEEERFEQTLNLVLPKFIEHITKLKEKEGGYDILSGEDAFKFYDTYGLPLDFQQEIAEEQGIKVDEAGFYRELTNQREMARARWKASPLPTAPTFYRELSEGLRVEFLGYQTLEAEAKVVAIAKEGAPQECAGPGERVEIILDRTPFYAEGGGQVGDTGTLTGDDVLVEVLDAKSTLPGLTVHYGRVRRGTLIPGQTVLARVSLDKRKATAWNHTATHLLHAALRQVLGEHVKQAGSLVAPDRLRFDFTHFGPLRDRELEMVEELVNEKIYENLLVTIRHMDLEEALAAGALAFFGEKYGEKVRVVEIDDFSKELCGGTHVPATGEIGLFKLVDVGGIAAGVRRVEAVTGISLYEHIRRQERIQRRLEELLKTHRDEIPEKLEKLLTIGREKEREIARLKSLLAAKLADELLREARMVNGITVVAGRTEFLDQKGLRELADQIRARVKTGVVVLGTVADGRVQWLAAVTPDLVGRLHAGKLVQEVARITGGGGGGKADLAEAGGKDPGKLEQAIAAVVEIVKKLLVPVS